MVGLHMLDCCCLPVHLVLLGPCMYCDVVFHIVSLHCSFVLLFIVFSSVLPVSPMCTLSHSAHGTWYTTPFFFHSSWGSFVCTKASLRVPYDLKVVLMPRRLYVLSILSLTHLTYGKWRNLGVVVCSCSSVRVEE